MHDVVLKGSNAVVATADFYATALREQVKELAELQMQLEGVQQAGVGVVVAWEGPEDPERLAAAVVELKRRCARPGMPMPGSRIQGGPCRDR